MAIGDKGAASTILQYRYGGSAGVGSSSSDIGDEVASAMFGAGIDPDDDTDDEDDEDDDTDDEVYGILSGPRSDAANDFAAQASSIGEPLDPRMWLEPGTDWTKWRQLKETPVTIPVRSVSHTEMGPLMDIASNVATAHGVQVQMTAGYTPETYLFSFY